MPSEDDRRLKGRTKPLRAAFVLGIPHLAFKIRSFAKGARYPRLWAHFSERRIRGWEAGAEQSK